jgi:hypothetical protein
VRRDLIRFALRRRVSCYRFQQHRDNDFTPPKDCQRFFLLTKQVLVNSRCDSQ